MVSIMTKISISLWFPFLLFTILAPVADYGLPSTDLPWWIVLVLCIISFVFAGRILVGKGIISWSGLSVLSFLCLELCFIASDLATWIIWGINSFAP